MFCPSFSENRKGSCGTIAISSRSRASRSRSTGTPSIRTVPRSGSYSRAISFTIELLPAPVGPTIAAVCPGSIRNEIPRSTQRSVPGYLNQTSSNSIAPRGASISTGRSGSTIDGSSSRISSIRPIEAAPRSNRLITQPSAIIGQVSCIR